MTIPDDKTVTIAMLGMVDGNGHPYSWSALCNGYDRSEMANCPYPIIPVYLGAVPKSRLRIPKTQVTHIWTDNPKDAEAVARAALIPNIVKRPEEVIGKVDAICIPTDKGWEHADRIRPFIEADIPIFIDKPLCDKEEDLRHFIKLYGDGVPILTSSCMRYAKEIHAMIEGIAEVGDMRLITGLTPKTWERYGIHALEGLYQITGPGFLTAKNIGTEERNIVILKHRNEADCFLYAYMDAFGGFGAYQVIGTRGVKTCKYADTYYAFRAQFEAFIQFVRTREYPFPPEETFELMRIIIAGIRSREEGGKEITLADIAPTGAE